MSTDEMVLGKCDNCGEDRNLYPDMERCEDCDGLFYHCSICDEDQSEDDHCRHIFQDDNFEWCGSGAYMDPALKKPLFRLLNAMPEGFAVDLAAAIRSGRFYTFLTAPLIGRGGIMSLYGFSDVGKSLSYGKAMIEIGEDEESEEVADGYHWLASLYECETPKANKLTLQWLDEYLFRPRQFGNPETLRAGSLTQ